MRPSDFDALFRRWADLRGRYARARRIPIDDAAADLDAVYSAWKTVGDDYLSRFRAGNQEVVKQLLEIADGTEINIFSLLVLDELHDREDKK